MQLVIIVLLIIVEILIIFILHHKITKRPFYYIFICRKNKVTNLLTDLNDQVMEKLYPCYGFYKKNIQEKPDIKSPFYSVKGFSFVNYVNTSSLLSIYSVFLDKILKHKLSIMEDR